VLVDLSLIATGLVLLSFAGSKLIDFSVAVSERARLTPAVIGLTVVSAGTSAPELFVSVTAALRGSPDIAIANVVGSNVANIALVLALCALVAPIPVDRALLRLEYPFMLLASWITLLLCRDGSLDRLEGGFFLTAMVGFVAYSVWIAREAAGAALEEAAGAARLARLRLPLLLLGLAACFAGLGVGARLLVAGATSVAAALGVSERVIGLTIVAVGTSLPELVASLAAALKRQHAMAVTNIVGSNIFNLLLILGATALVRPIPVAAALVSPDMWVMMATALVLLPLFAIQSRVGRVEGALMLAGYTAYMILLTRS